MNRYQYTVKFEREIRRDPTERKPRKAYVSVDGFHDTQWDKAIEQCWFTYTQDDDVRDALLSAQNAVIRAMTAKFGPMIQAALVAAGIACSKPPKWDKKAGCSCGCSPGWVLDADDQTWRNKGSMYCVRLTEIDTQAPPTPLPDTALLAELGWTAMPEVELSATPLMASA